LPEIEKKKVERKKKEVGQLLLAQEVEERVCKRNQRCLTGIIIIIRILWKLTPISI